MRAFIQKFTMILMSIILLVGIGYAVIAFFGRGEVNLYSVLFSQNIEGVVENVEKVSPQVALVGGGITAATSKELFSFAVGIKTKNGEIITGTTEDRQWAIVQKGQCARAKFYPYPPWDLDKSGTFYNVRLLKLWDCGSTVAPQATAPVSQTNPAEVLPKVTPPAAAAVSPAATAPALAPPAAKATPSK